LNVDLTATHINENEAWTEELNLLNRLKLNAWFDLGPLQVYGGPSINVHVSNLRDAEGNPGSALVDPEFTCLDETSGRTRTLIYPGFNFGIRF
jgi:ABC-type arginine transport system ATPase subunit